jgi:DNA-binding winged helix-turn-helix (wHTH) protein/tetratricopeptide (TPR) repeat protein
MTLQPDRGTVYRFGLYEVHTASGDLFRQGRRIRLQEQPFRLLISLLQHPDQIVSRETLRQRLWPGDTFVEFDQSLATAVTKLRQALGDSADNPRFIETVPKRGYRFLAPVTVIDQPKTVMHDQISAPPATRTDLPPVPHDPQPEQHKYRKARYAIITAAVAVVLGAVIGVHFYQKRNAFLFTPRDTILVADFVNTTGEPVFDDALRQGLEIGLQQSPVINVLSDRKTGTILKEMGHSSEERVTGKIAVEACQRAGSKVAIQGSVSSLGTNYLIDLAAIRCDNGDPLALEQVQAKQKEDVVDALGKITTQLRTRLGESLPSIRKYDVPLAQATTPSLEALKAYSLGLSTWDQKGDEPSIPFFKRAVEIDPNFAMAYGALGTIYHNLNEDDLASASVTKAYELRDRVTEFEKLAIESWYFLYVTGDLEKAAQVYEFSVQDYPNAAGAFNHLGTTYAELGHYQSGAEKLTEALRLDPTRATTYANLATDLLALNRIDQASAVLDDASKRKMETDFLLQVRYWEAFLRGDHEQMQRIIQRGENVPGARSLLLSEQANTEAYYGHFEKARQLSEAAADLMKSEGDKEEAADCLAEAAVREAEIGNARQARAFVAQAIQIAPDQNVMALAAFAMATLGDLEQETSLSDRLDKEYPFATIIQKYWLPTIRAEVELHRGKGENAVHILEAAVPYESASLGGLSISTLYPAYVRGEAYLAMGDGTEAAAEFQKLIDNPGLVLNMPLGALARLGRARAYSRLSDPEKTRAAYQDFLQLWKDADPNLPILSQTHSEFSHLNFD